MTDKKQKVREAIKGATAEQHNTRGAAGIIGALFCECRLDAMLILDAATAWSTETLIDREEFKREVVSMLRDMEQRVLAGSAASMKKSEKIGWNAALDAAIKKLEEM